MPMRIQRKRSKGWRMPPNAVYVGRPTEWGNPYKAPPLSRAAAIDLFRKWMVDRPWLTPARIREHLGGKDLACWCPLVENDGNRVHCHADVLLEIANSLPEVPHG